jgi:hypothetical protein
MAHEVAVRPTHLSDVNQLCGAQLLDRMSGWIWLESEIRDQLLEGAWPFLQGDQDQQSVWMTQRHKDPPNVLRNARRRRPLAGQEPRVGCVGGIALVVLFGGGRVTGAGGFLWSRPAMVTELELAVRGSPAHVRWARKRPVTVVVCPGS